MAQAQLSCQGAELSATWISCRDIPGEAVIQSDAKMLMEVNRGWFMGKGKMGVGSDGIKRVQPEEQTVHCDS